MTKSKGNVAKASIGYTIGNYFLKGIGLITVPIFSRLLTTSDFGIYNTFLAYEAILYLFIELALHESLKNAKYKFEGKLDDYTSSITVIPIVLTVIYETIVFIFGKMLVPVVGLNKTVLYLLVWYSFCSGMVIYYRFRLALDYNYNEYLKISFANVLINVILSLFLIINVFDQERYMGRIIGGIVSYSAITIYILFRLYKKAFPKYNLQYWKYGLKIGVPIVPHGLAQILLLQFDRIMINSIVGSVETGIYSFAYTIYSLIQIFSQSLETVFSPWVFSQMSSGNGKEKVRKMGTCFMLLLAGACTTVMLIAPEVILILGGKKYADSVYCVCPVVLGGFFSMSYCIPAVIEYFYEKTYYTSLGTTIAAAINVVLNLIFIKKYGYVAAAYTTLVSYMAYFALHEYISKQLCGFYMIINRYLFIALAILGIAFSIGILFVDNMIVRFSVLVILLVVGIYMLIQLYGKEEMLTAFNRMNSKRK
ncbi:oligosaccharide flippase family protein [Candidatus Bariatricus faecipullorum]